MNEPLFVADFFRFIDKVGDDQGGDKFRLAIERLADVTEQGGTDNGKS